jgi:peptide/nickel transport system permease protein
VAFLAGVMTTIIAVVIGASSAFLGGKADDAIMTMTDIWLALPIYLADCDRLFRLLE